MESNGEQAFAILLARARVVLWKRRPLACIDAANTVACHFLNGWSLL